jgi:Ca-activated chloride channel homolog
MKFTKILLLVICILLTSYTAQAQQANAKKKAWPTTRILFLFDASNSMYGNWQSGTKMEVAKKLFFNLLDSIGQRKDIELGLRVYGHQKHYPPQDCDDSKLEVPIAKNNVENIKNRMRTIKPNGTTPIAASLELAAKDFVKKDNVKNFIVLITDGVEACSGDPCAISKALQAQDIILKPFIIGIGNETEDFKKAFECVGTYFDATDEKNFMKILNIIITQALTSTTVQVNLMDAYNKPNETNVAMTFVEESTGNIKYDYMHTINNRGEPDTVLLDPQMTYKLVVHTIPPVEKKGIKLNMGRHNIIPVDCGRGSLLLKSQGAASEYKALQYIVRKNNDLATLNVQQLNTTEKYLVGKYDLEVLTIPRLIIKDVAITQNKVTTVEIPQPGILSINSTSTGYGCIYQQTKNEQKLVYNLNETLVQEKITMQPGNYKIVYRPRTAHETIYTVEKEFKIESGSSVQIKL